MKIVSLKYWTLTYNVKISFRLFNQCSQHCTKTTKNALRLCLVPGKFEGKCKGKKIQRKSRRKEKVKENKKID